MSDPKRSEAPAGLLVADKPAGVTSHDVVAVLRRVLGGARTGHGGTLDPIATGVLPLLVGPATRLLRFLPANPKIYSAVVQLGIETDTGDISGTPSGAPRPVRVSDEAVATALASLSGPQLQMPPMYSAKKVGGRRLYQAARAGLEVERRPARVEIHRLALERREVERLWIEVECSPGTYVRSLVVDLGHRLGTGATLLELRRIRSGPFTLAGALSWDELRDSRVVRSRLRSLEELPLDLETVQLEAASIAWMRAGRAVPLQAAPSVAPEAGLVQVRSASGLLVGVALWEPAAVGGLLRPRLVLPETGAETTPAALEQAQSGH